ncbi:MAG TPA: DJ-1/PfpI family protein [Propionibacteriaceae bacterium]
MSTDILDVLREAHGRGARVVSVCIGAFALAAAGLRDGKRAMTRWRNASALQLEFSNVTVDTEVLYIEEANVATSAGIAAGIDLCLQLAAWSFVRTARVVRRNSSSGRSPKRQLSPRCVRGREASMAAT